MVQSFQPAVTSTLAVTSTTGNVALVGAGQRVRICNTGSAVAFFKFVSSSAGTAAITDTPIPSGGFTEVFSRGLTDTYVAAICGGSDTTTLYFTTGDGI